MHDRESGSARPLVPRTLLRIAAAVVLLASLASGGRAFYKDLTLAFRWAGPSVFAPTVQRQLTDLKSRLPPGSTVLLVSNWQGDVTWYSRLFQRGLYPTDVAIVRYNPLPNDATMRPLLSRYAVRYAISMGDPPTDPGFIRHEDLGPLPGLADRVWFGELAP